MTPIRIYCTQRIDIQCGVGPTCGKCDACAAYNVVVSLQAELVEARDALKGQAAAAANIIERATREVIMEKAEVDSMMTALNEQKAEIERLKGERHVNRLLLTELAKILTPAGYPDMIDGGGMCSWAAQAVAIIAELEKVAQRMAPHHWVHKVLRAPGHLHGGRSQQRTRLLLAAVLCSRVPAAGTPAGVAVCQFGLRQVRSLG